MNKKTKYYTKALMGCLIIPIMALGFIYKFIAVGFWAGGEGCMNFMDKDDETN